jgi:hypothetical protein
MRVPVSMLEASEKTVPRPVEPVRTTKGHRQAATCRTVETHVLVRPDFAVHTLSLEAGIGSCQLVGGPVSSGGAQRCDPARRGVTTYRSMTCLQSKLTSPSSMKRVAVRP